MITVKCEVCGKEFQKYPSSSKKYCSMNCRDEAKKRKTEMVEFICEQCGKPFLRTAREARRVKKIGGEIRFCSKKCKSDFWGRNRKLVTCPVCGKEFLQQERLAKYNRCCSSECAAKNPNNRNAHPQEMVTLVCEACGKEFTKPASYIKKQEKRGQRVRFCSTKCAGHEAKNLSQIACKQCGKMFQPRSEENEFCSEECVHAYRHEQNSHTLICAQCGKEFETTRYKYEHGRKYCSMECRRKAVAVERDTYAKLQHYLRNCKEYQQWHSAVLEKAGWSCQDCGAHGGILNAHHKLSLYRIAKMYDFDEDKIIASQEFNDVDNGECLCLDCHIKRHPYHKALRNKKGQFCRREFKTAKKLTIKRTELSGKTVEKPQSEPKAL